MKQPPKIKILFVDDDQAFTRFTQDLIFRRVGIRPLVAHNGLEAEEIIQKCCPDIIITDTNMPLRNGVELIRSVREKYPQVVIFSLFSGLLDSPITADDIKALGVYMVLNKSELPTRLLPALDLFIAKQGESMHE